MAPAEGDNPCWISPPTGLSGWPRPTASAPGAAATRARDAKDPLFTTFYNPSNLTSFDDLLSRPYLSIVGSAPKHSPAPASAPEAASGAPSATEPSPLAPEGKNVPSGWLAVGEDGSCVEHPLWTNLVTWGGAVQYGLMDETLETVPLGAGDVQVRRPKHYVECDKWQARVDALLEAPEAQAEAEAIYSRFSSEGFAEESATAPNYLPEPLRTGV